MFNIIFQALFFFLPAYISNAIPVFLAKTRMFEFLNIPVDFGTKIGKYDLFGKTKTYRGIIGGVVGGLLTVCFQAFLYESFPSLGGWFLIPYEFPAILWLGFLLGIGEGLGDLFKSFIKRRMKMASSAQSFPLDQLSFLGAVFLSYFYLHIPFYHLVVILIISPLVPFMANLLAYRLGWKKVWW